MMKIKSDTLPAKTDNYSDTRVPKVGQLSTEAYCKARSVPMVWNVCHVRDGCLGLKKGQGGRSERGS